MLKSQVNFVMSGAAGSYLRCFADTRMKRIMVLVESELADRRRILKRKHTIAPEPVVVAPAKSEIEKGHPSGWGWWRTVVSFPLPLRSCLVCMSDLVRRVRRCQPIDIGEGFVKCLLRDSIKSSKIHFFTLTYFKFSYRPVN